ncbi:MAG: CHAT domain-containing protein [Xanthomonadaceae bacterium]|nr:CHAT domain-containing protein [Xanthomonadaceae bacterium]
MSAGFDLIVDADTARRSAEFRLCDANGIQLAFRQTRFDEIPVGRQQGLFDLRNYLRLYVEEGKEADAIAEIGVYIAEEVLGQEIFGTLWRSQTQRTLRIKLPGANETGNLLAAALARVPWEIARPSLGQQTLGERNLLIRVVHDAKPAASQPLALATDEALRVLFVFAEARGSHPLGAREERRALLQMLKKEVYPNRRVVAHFLSHGVTRERLHAQIVENGGYHIVHWSGHGHLNLLELCRPGGSKDLLSGEELLDLFTSAGGFLPRLFFLSACHSGDILRISDWKDFMAVAQGRQLGTRATPTDADTRKLDLQDQPGYTGTAHALLQGGVPSVVAMRYAVGDDYARELAVEFYRALLAHAQTKTAAAALTLARKAMQNGTRPHAARFAACDHATPVLYGDDDPRLVPPKGLSPEIHPRNPRLHQIVELTTAGHEHFVGRTWELAGMGADFIGASTGDEIKPVAVITGLGGMGKTALVAEALMLWESRFEWVLLYQAKPHPLGFDAFLRDAHLQLTGELGRYHDHVKRRPADAIHRDADASFSGTERQERLIRNLLRALADEPILLVLDNFETNLKSQHEGEPASACQDPAWDQCLDMLARGLVGTPSRVLVTCRRPLTALPGDIAHPVALGPLPSSEAALYLRAHPTLSGMMFGADKAECELAMRLLKASRFHPLLMDRLARLTAEPQLRPQLLQALDTLESTGDFARLPELFATRSADDTELAYLNDALAASIDQLIRNAGPDARRLLWMIAVANEPVALGLLAAVWSGESHEQQQLRQIKQMLDVMPSLPAEIQAELQSIPPDLRSMLDKLPPAPSPAPDIRLLLAQIVSAGLVNEEFIGPDDTNRALSCHEMVRERIHAWMSRQPEDQGTFTDKTIRLAYADRLHIFFEVFQHQNLSIALQAGTQALIYYVQSEAWERLDGFASSIVTGTKNSQLLQSLVPHLQTAVEAVPEGKLRWSCLCYLADALRNGFRVDMSLPIYQQAACLARCAAEAGGDHSKSSWSDLAAITGNWANALTSIGNLDEARLRLLESAEAARRAEGPSIEVIARELEVLRIDIKENKLDSAMPEIELRLAQTQTWWKQHRAGQKITDAPDAEFLARVSISALDIAKDFDFARDRWESALSRLESMLEIQRSVQRTEEDIGSTRVNRAIALMKIPGKLDEAKTELEACLLLFRNDPQRHATVLSSLAELLDRQQDLDQAITQQRRALSVREQLPDPIERATSHNNLANFLEKRETEAALAESRHHQLAALLYSIVVGHWQYLQITAHNYVLDFRHAQSSGIDFIPPRITNLIADPAFAALDQWLRQQQVSIDTLQTAVDEFLEQARQAAFSSGESE